VNAPAADELDLAAATVMIVDDNLQNLELLQAYVEDLGCTVLTATDGIEALDLIASRPGASTGAGSQAAAGQPDIVLLDVMMPRMSGFQVCERLKANPDTRDIPIIMVTALNEVGDVERAVEAGADDFLTKPVNKLELLTRVRSLLRVRMLKRQLERTLEQVREARAEGGAGDAGRAPAE
jgi:two-component system cell cycle response regulator